MQDRQRQECPNGHENHETDVGAIVDRARRGPVIIHSKWNEATNHSAQVEDAPEQGNVGALPIMRRVRRHDRTLCSPEEAGADAEEGAGDDGEHLALVVVVVEKGAGVEDIGRTPTEQGELRAQDVVDPAAENAEDGEGGVEGGVGVVGCGVVDLASAAHAGEGVEHAGAAETDESDQDDLN